MKALGKVGRYLMAVSLVVFGVQHFLYAKFVATLVPAWIPGHLFWALFVGVAFFAAAVGMLSDKVVRPAATLLGVMFLIFVVTTHIPRIVMQLNNGNEWTSGLVALAMCGAAWIIAKAAPLEERETGGPLLSLGRCFFAAAMLAFGILHFVDTRLLAHVGPPWVADKQLWAYLMGAVLLAVGVGILIGQARVAGAALATVLPLMFLIVHVPRLIAQPHNPNPWTSGFEILAMAGAAMVLSASPAPRLVE